MIGTPGELEAAYDLGRELGRGAFGCVLEGKAHSTGRRVAIKLPLAPPDPAQRARIEREAKLLAGLSHPRLAGFHGLLLDRAGLPALVYDLVPGRSLEAHLAAVGRLAPDAALPLVRGMAEGLEALHGAGLMHRDLKPANVMVTPDGEVVLLDYGLARPVGEGQTLTRTGTVMGTPAYLAPEQFSGARLGPATDLYALGCIAFELLAGEPPFTGSAMEVIESHLKAEPPPLAAAAPGLSRGLDRVLHRALAKDPAARPASALAWAAELAQAATPSRSSATRELDREASTRILGNPPPARIATIHQAAPVPAPPGPPRPTPTAAGPRGFVRPLVVAGGVAALALAAGLLGRPGGQPAPESLPPNGPAAAPPAEASELEAFVAALVADPAIHEYLALPGDTPIERAYEARDLARSRFETRAEERDLVGLLGRLLRTPVDGDLGRNLARLIRDVWPLAMARGRDSDGALKEPQLLGGRVVPALDRLTARLFRIRREPGLAFFTPLGTAEVNEHLQGEERRRRIHEELVRRPDPEVDPIALELLGRGGARWDVLFGTSRKPPGTDLYARIRAQGPTGIPVHLARDLMGADLGNSPDLPTVFEVPLARPATGDLLLGLAAYNLNPKLPCFVVSFEFRDPEGRPVGEVAYPLPGPNPDGREALLPGSEPLSKRVGLLLRIRRDAVPATTARLAIRVFTIQATGVVLEILGVHQLLVHRQGPEPADLAGTWEDGAPGPFLAGPEEDVQRLWARLARTPKLVAALALGGATADDAIQRAWEDGREVFAAAAYDLRKALTRLAGAPIGPTTLATLSWLRLVSQVLTVTRLGKPEPFLEGTLDPALDAAIGRAVTIDPIPELDDSYVDPLAAKAADLARRQAFMEGEERAGRRWAVLRSVESLHLVPKLNSKLRLATPLGVQADSAYTSIWSGAEFSGQLRGEQAALESVPSSIPVALAPFRGDLVLVMRLADWRSEIQGLVLRMVVEGRSGSTELALLPRTPAPEAIFGQPTRFGMVGDRVRIRASALPDAPTRIVLTGHGLRPIADDSATANIHEIYQLVEGDR